MTQFRFRSRSPRRLALTCALVGLLGAACGSSSSSSSADDEDLVESTEAEVDQTDPTDAPTTTTAPSTTASPTTEPPTTATPATAENPAIAALLALDHPMVLVRRITEDDGIFLTPEGNDPVIEARIYEFTCDDVACSSVTLGSSSLSGDEAEPFQVGFDGTTLSGTDARVVPCLDPTTGEATGPELTGDALNIEMTATDIGTGVPVFEGVFVQRYENPGSAECQAESTGYVADAWMFDAATAPVIEPIEAVFGGEADVPSVERGIRRCTPADGACDFVLRQTFDRMLPDGGVVKASIDWLLSGDPVSGYTGTTIYDEGCLSDVDRSFVSADAYETTHTVMLRTYDVASGVLIVDEHRSAVPLATLTPEQAAVCAPFERTVSFVGLPISTPLAIDWSMPAEP